MTSVRDDTEVETNATLKVVRTRVKYFLMYSKTENAILRSLPWTQVANFISKGQCFVGTYQQQLSRLPTTTSTLNSVRLSQMSRHVEVFIFHVCTV